MDLLYLNELINLLLKLAEPDLSQNYKFSLSYNSLSFQNIFLSFVCGLKHSIGEQVLHLGWMGVVYFLEVKATRIHASPAL